MQLQVHYDPDQDRVLLQWDGGSPAGKAALWLTRRQWVALAVACDRARAAGAGGSGSGSGSGSGKDVGTRRSPAAAVKAKRSPPPQRQAAVATASPVTGIKFRQGPAGLRIEFTSAEPTPVVLALRGESLASFADLVARLAAKAKWDLDAALLRISQTPAAPKRMLH